MTPIQAQSLPAILEGKDVQAQAKTGSGKTAAFAIGLLHRLDAQNYQTQALVLCPTRELADQVSKEIRRLARSIPNTKILTLCGGTPMGGQLASLDHQPHIVVGTPGRILKHLQKGSLKLDDLKTLVLDEGDRMLDMGFHDDIMSIVKFMPAKRQTLLFSATYPDEIKDISKAVQKDPIDIQVESLHDDKKIKQVFYEIEKGDRTKTLIALLHHYRPESSVVFCNRKHQCRELAEELWHQGFHALALHGDLERNDRDRVLVQFSNKSSSILIATDVAARGLDIKDLDLVINYEIPNQSEVYVHRVGRTGRAGKSGTADTLYTPREASKIEGIEEEIGEGVSYGYMDKFKQNDLYTPKYITLKIDGGKKDKLRPGDIVGAITSTKTIKGDEIGNISVTAMRSYVAVERDKAKMAFNLIRDGKMKNRNFRVHLLD